MHRGERLPNVIKEAIAASCYCLTTPTPDIDELITDASIGQVLPAKKLEAWVGALLTFFERVDIGEGEVARQHVLRQFDIVDTASVYALGGNSPTRQESQLHAVQRHSKW